MNRFALSIYINSFTQPWPRTITQFSILKKFGLDRFRIALKVIREIRVICEICGMKAPRSRADRVSGYRNNVNYILQQAAGN